MNNDNRYLWKHKDLLDVSQLSREDTVHLLDLAASFQEINRRPVKKVPTLKGKTVVLFFSENSTRTKTSFDMAGKRLSADTFALSKSGSSINKGETLKDTAQTLMAMNPDVIVIRHSASGAAEYLSKLLPCSIVNGDIDHSRVARSNLYLLNLLGAKVRICAPRTLLPAGVDSWNCDVYTNVEEAVRGVDAVMCLRLQLERQEAGLLPDLMEYSRRYCLTKKRLALAKPGAYILHPGPMNRGLEIADDIADTPQSLVLNQVSAGVAVRMAILYLLTTRNEG